MSESTNESKDVLVELCGSYVAGVLRFETPKAILIDFHGVEKWIPKSQCEIVEHKVIVEDWLAEKIQAELGEAY